MAMVTLESCYERARQSMSQGEYEQAEGICWYVLQYYPQDLGTFQLLGQINLERKRNREARDHFRRVLEIDPENISAHWGMGIAYQDDGNLEQTIAEFEQALEIKPDLSDLRAQLLRLYSETEGAAQAQVRLSRAGLGRLYVKGGLLDKAIAEFQEVLKLDPQRADVQVSLIDALWQRGDMERSARVCEEVLQRLPDALKANLVLGYVHLQAGRQEAAEGLWRKAEACDPNNTMARALFETAPKKIPDGMIVYGAATLPDFDETTWKAALAAAAAAARPPEPVEAPAPAPLEEPPAAPLPADEPVGISWLDSLATGEGAVDDHEAELLPGIAPFDVEGLDLLDETAVPSFGPSAPAAEPAPFSLEEEEAVAPFALEDEEAVAPFTFEDEAAAPFTFEDEAAAPFSLEDEEAVAPFSLEDEAAAPFTFEDEAVAPFSLEEEFPPAEPAAAPAVAAAEPPPPSDQEMRPFSLEDLGLSDDEIASLEEAIAATKTVELPAEPTGLDEAELPVGLEPFSLEELALPDEEAGLPDVAPFSLEDVLAPDQESVLEETPWPAEKPALAAEPAGLAEEAELPGVSPFSLEEAVVPGDELIDIPGLEPFSVESLGLSDFLDGAVAPAGLAGELKPFSLEELGLEEPSGEFDAAGLDRFPDAFGDDLDPGLPTFSWQEAASSKAPAFRGQLEKPAAEAEPGGPSLFEKMKASRPEPETPDQEDGAWPPSAAPAKEEVAPISREEVGLEEVSEPAEAELPAVKPFSVEAFGLEEELALEEEAAAGVAPFSLEEMGLEEPSLPPARGEAAFEPFSLAELGLEEEPAPADVAEIAVPPFTPEEPEELPVEEPPVVAPAEDVLRPFSLEELGLTPDEIAALGLEEEAAAVMEGMAPAVEEAPPAVEEAPPAVEEAPPAVETAPPALDLEELRAQVAAHPQDETMLLTLARAGVAQDAPEEAFGAYKQLIKTGQAGLEDALIGDIQSWIEREEDYKRLHRLHRLLGDAYMKKGWYQQAINEYAWVLSKQ